MSEYIIRETGYPGQLKQEVAGELVRCKDCIHWDKEHTEECGNPDSICFRNGWCKPDWFCGGGERRES